LAKSQQQPEKRGQESAPEQLLDSETFSPAPREGDRASYKRQFIQTLNQVGHRHSDAEVFHDWAEVAGICLHQIPYNMGILPKDEDYERLEARYMGEFVPKYGREGLTYFAQMLGILQLASSLEKFDFLGEVYGELELYRKRNAEFFTPDTISRTVAKMLLDRTFLEREISEAGYIAIQEPACGAGSMLIATVQAVEELGFDPCQTMFFEGTDINRICFNMTYIQMSILGIAGYVIHGNSISQEIWEKRPTPKLQIRLKQDNIDWEAITLARILMLFRELATSIEQEPEVITQTPSKAAPEDTGQMDNWGGQNFEQLSFFEDAQTS
jgi:type I restriction-modification system DNA methylase subunit